MHDDTVNMLVDLCTKPRCRRHVTQSNILNILWPLVSQENVTRALMRVTKTISDRPHIVEIIQLIDVAGENVSQSMSELMLRMIDTNTKTAAKVPSDIVVYASNVFVRNISRCGFKTMWYILMTIWSRVRLTDKQIGDIYSNCPLSELMESEAQTVMSMIVTTSKHDTTQQLCKRALPSYLQMAEGQTAQSTDDDINPVLLKLLGSFVMSPSAPQVLKTLETVNIDFWLGRLIKSCTVAPYIVQSRLDVAPSETWRAMLQTWSTLGPQIARMTSVSNEARRIVCLLHALHERTPFDLYSFGILEGIAHVDSRCTNGYIIPYAASLCGVDWKTVTIRLADFATAIGLKENVSSYYHREHERELLIEAFDAVKVPDTFLCPITKEIMIDPMVASDGHSYEREAIETVLRTSKKSPMTREVLKSSLVPNRALRKRLREYADEVHEQTRARTTDA